MSSYYQFNPQTHPTPAAPGTAHNHGSRSRRAPRLSVSHGQPKQLRGVRSAKELVDSVTINEFRSRFEACRSFDLEDDMEFCPGLLTDSDMNSIHSSSERSSLASNSPESSPTQQPQTMASTFCLKSSSPAFVPAAYQQAAVKLHPSSSARPRNAIPIVNPATGITMSSPPPSVSPVRVQQAIHRW